MSDFMLLLMMCLIGAAIGGITNSLAIKMLFRPYQPKHVFGWKLPFTPGLIPKRRQELAKQLGKMVVEHLLTAEGLKRKLEHEEFQTQLKSWAQQETKRMLQKDISVQQQLDRFGITVNDKDVKLNLSNWSVSAYEHILESRRHLRLNELLDEQWIRKAEKSIDHLTDYTQRKIGQFVDSEASREKLEDLIETFLEGRGFFGNMISSFVGKEGLVDKIQPMLASYVKSEEARQWIHRILLNELNYWLDQRVENVERRVGKEAVVEVIGQLVNKLPVHKWLQQTVQETAAPIIDYVTETALPPVISAITKSVSNRMDTLLERMHLEEIVEKEVEAFPIQRIEQLVLSISKKEFKLITYLGALLGGLIGIVQGIIVIFLS